MITLPSCVQSYIVHKYLQEGVHLFLDPIDEPPLNDQAVEEKRINMTFRKMDSLMFCDKKCMYVKNIFASITLCIPFCSHWSPPSLSRWASGQPGMSERQEGKLWFTEFSLWVYVIEPGLWQNKDNQLWIWACTPVQSCPHQYKTSGPTQ